MQRSSASERIIKQFTLGTAPLFEIGMQYLCDESTCGAVCGKIYKNFLATVCAGIVRCNAQIAPIMAKKTIAPKPSLPAIPTHVPIVSSAHLATGARPELSELEYGLIVHSHAFSRWMMMCMSAAGMKDLSAMEIMVLHHIVHRARPKRIADICFVLNVEDTHVITYALKKLEAAGVVARSKEGKEAVFEATDAGRALCERYREVREQCLTQGVVKEGISRETLHEVATVLRMLSGIYDQAARAAASL